MNAVFVFGSNLAGRHGGGAARHALEHCGAIYGQGIGLQGQSYGIPTKDERIQTLPLDEIAKHVGDFIAFARFRSDLSFVVTAVGCGLAGLDARDIAPMFASAPENVFLSAKLVAGLSADTEILGALTPPPTAAPSPRAVQRPEDTTSAVEALQLPWHISDFEPGCGGNNRMVMGADGFSICYISGRSEAEHEAIADFICKTSLLSEPETDGTAADRAELAQRLETCAEQSEAGRNFADTPQACRAAAAMLRQGAKGEQP